MNKGKRDREFGESRQQANLKIIQREKDVRKGTFEWSKE